MDERRVLGYRGEVKGNNGSKRKGERKTKCGEREKGYAGGHLELCLLIRMTPFHTKHPSLPPSFLSSFYIPLFYFLSVCLSLSLNVYLFLSLSLSVYTFLKLSVSL